jgi:hypothetical protein
MHLSMLTPRGGGGGGRAYVGYLIINCIPTLGILISILAPSWGNLNRMTFINIVFIAIYCKMVGHLTNIYCPTVGHLIENLLKKSNAPPMSDPPPLWGLTLIGALVPSNHILKCTFSSIFAKILLQSIYFIS